MPVLSKPTTILNKALLPKDQRSTTLTQRKYNVSIRALTTNNMPKWIKDPAQYDMLLSEIPRYSFLAHIQIIKGIRMMWDFYQTVAIKFFDICRVQPWMSLYQYSKNRSELIQNAEWVVLRADIIPFFSKLRPRSHRVIKARLRDMSDFGDIDKLEVTPSRTFRPAHPTLDYPEDIQRRIY